MRPHGYLAMVSSGLLLLAGCSKGSGGDERKPPPDSDQRPADKPAHDPRWGTIGPLRDGTLPNGIPDHRGVIAPPTDRPLVKIGRASVVGDLDKNIIRRYVRRKLPRIQNCYAKALAVRPELEGTVEVDFQISAEGTVTSAVAKGIEESVSGCVAKVIETIQFPRPRGGSSVQAHYPLDFEPPGDPAGGFDAGAPAAGQGDPSDSRAKAAPPGPSGPAWRELFRERYGALGAVNFDHGPVGRCERLRDLLGADVVRGELRPTDQQVFARQLFRVSEIRGDREAIYRAYTAGDQVPDPCVSKMSQLIVVWGRWQAELLVACGAGQLVHYEIGDFLAFLSQVLGAEGRPDQAVLSVCGRMKMKRWAIDDLMANAAKTRSLWGKSFPAHRQEWISNHRASSDGSSGGPAD